MNDTKSETEARDKLWSMIKGIGFAMLTTSDGGSLRARPMVVAQDHFDGTLWFFTRKGSHMVDEVESDHQVGVTYADPDHQNYVSLSGIARLRHDRATVQEHWSEAMRAWFPKGIDDPDAAVLEVRIEQAEYWDAPNSTMVHVYGYIKARLTGTSPHPGENQKLSFGETSPVARQ